MTEKQKNSKTEFKKYIPYALGEIVLVVIGILIAVSLNSWNNNTKNTVQAEEYLVKITNELNSDTMVFKKFITRIEQVIEIKSLILNCDQLDTLPVTYLDLSLNTQYMNAKINDASFLGMTNPDILHMSEFQEIFEKVNHYYTFNQDYLTNFNEWEEALATKEAEFWEEQGDFEISLLSYSNDSILIKQNPTVRKEKIIDKIKSTKGRNFLKISLNRFISVKDLYILTKKAAEQLLEDISKSNKTTANKT